MLVDAKCTVAIARTHDEWLAHPAGQAVNAEPIFDVQAGAAIGNSWKPAPGRALAGIKVLDLTRVVAGPTGTRFLAACGAEVLRIDCPGSDESAGPFKRVPDDLMLGKRWAFLDLRKPEDKARFLELLSEADVLVHVSGNRLPNRCGRRPGAHAKAEDRRGIGHAHVARAHRRDLDQQGMDSRCRAGHQAARRRKPRRTVGGSRLLERPRTGQAPPLPGDYRPKPALLGAPRGGAGSFQPRLGDAFAAAPQVGREAAPANVAHGSSTSFQAQVAHSRLSPDSRHIVATH
jgi:CoA-transferase family III